VARSDGRLLHMSLRSNEPHKRVRVALRPPRRRVWFLLGGVVSSSILWGYSETERLLEEVVDDGLDDDDPFFFGEKACRFLPWLQHSLPHKYISGVFNR
jgi:hypothetical protein